MYICFRLATICLCYICVARAQRVWRTELLQQLEKGDATELLRTHDRASTFLLGEAEVQHGQRQVANGLLQALPEAPADQQPTQSSAAQHGAGLRRMVRYIGTVLLLCCACTVSVTAGVGGGGLYVPILILGAGVSAHEATGLSQSMMAGGTLAGCILNYRQKHPSRPRMSLIDVSMVLLLGPVQISGANVGVLLNRIFPSWLILSLTVVILGYTSVKTYSHAMLLRGTERAEERAGRRNVQLPTIPIPGGPNGVSTRDLSSQGVATGFTRLPETDEAPDGEVAPCSEYQNYLLGERSPRGRLGWGLRSYTTFEVSGGRRADAPCARRTLSESALAFPYSALLKHAATADLPETSEICLAKSCRETGCQPVLLSTRSIKNEARTTQSATSSKVLQFPVFACDARTSGLGEKTNDLFPLCRSLSENYCEPLVDKQVSMENVSENTKMRPIVDVAEDILEILTRRRENESVFEPPLSYIYTPARGRMMPAAKEKGQAPISSANTECSATEELSDLKKEVHSSSGNSKSRPGRIAELLLRRYERTFRVQQSHPSKLSDQEQTELHRRKDRKRLLLLLSVYCLNLLVTLASAGSRGLTLASYCTPAYWLLFAASSCMLIFTSVCVALDLVHTETLRAASRCLQAEDGIRCATMRAMLTLLSHGFIAGVAAGIVGVGGGMILGPVMLSYKMHPRVVSAVNAALVLCSSSSATINFLVTGRVQPALCVFFFMLCFCSAAFGKGFLDMYIRQHNMVSILVLVLFIIMVLSLICMVASGTLDLLAHGFAGFTPLCP